MTASDSCSICGASLPEGQTCEDQFHQALYWENEYPEKTLPVHHLLVLGYHLQHPHLYSHEGLAASMGLLVGFVAEGKSPQEVRQQQKDAVNSGKRSWKITARPDSIGTYAHPVQWQMTLAEVIHAGVEGYDANIRHWVQTLYDDLASSGNLPT